MPLLAAITGVVAGVGAMTFNLLLHWISHHVVGGLMGMEAPELARDLLRGGPSARSVDGFLVVFLPALGGLISGLLCDRFAPQAMGHGTDGAIEAFHRFQGKVRALVPVIKLIATSFTLGFGGSGGTEGPIAQIGSGTGSLIAQGLGLSPRRTRVLLVAGMAAGIAAIFEAPVAAMIFAGEILYRGADIDGEVLVPSAIASVVAYSVYVGSLSWFSGVVRWSHLFRVPAWTFESGFELVGYTVLAAACAMTARLWIRIFYGVHDAFDRFPIPRWAKPALGGFLTGLLAYLAVRAGAQSMGSAILGGGYGHLQLALDGRLPIGFLAVLFLLKMLATAFSIGSGGSGGVFGPSLVLGGFVGGGVGLGLQMVHPALVSDPGAYALVGMAALFGAAAHAPICSVIMVTEITRGYGLLVPSIWVCSLAFLLVGERSLYKKQVLHIEDSPAHQLEMRWNILNDLTCNDWMTTEVASINESASFEEIYDGLLNHRAYDKFPVVDDAGNVVGILSVKKLRAFFRDPEIRMVAIAGDAMDPVEIMVAKDTSLARAYETLVQREWSLLCVSEASGTTRLAGVLTRRDILLAYNREMTRRHQTWEEF